MSTHFVHRFKFSHEKRRRKFMEMVKKGKAVIESKTKDGFVVRTTNGVDYRVSNRGNVLVNDGDGSKQ